MNELDEVRRGQVPAPPQAGPEPRPKVRPRGARPGEAPPTRRVTRADLGNVPRVGDAPRGDPQIALRTWDDPAAPPRSMAELDLRPRPDVSYLESPADWREEPMYFVLLDRFNAGPDARPYGPPESPDSVHGGNITGLIAKLDAIKALGFTAIWVSPVVQNPENTYHGYAPMNFLAVDPSKGTMEDLRELCRQAHARGIRIVLDIVVNHTCHAFDYVGGDNEFNREAGPPKEIGEFLVPLYPFEIREKANFAARGEIRDWNDHEQSMTGDFYKYRKLNLARRPTQDLMIKIARWWMVQTGIDGFRCDAAKHVSPEFWSRFNAAVREQAAVLGKERFRLIGEAFDHDAERVAEYMKLDPADDGPADRGLAAFDSMFNIPAWIKAQEALHGDAPSRILEDAFWDSARALEGVTGASWTNLIDSHDVPRFVRPGDDPRVLEVGLAHVLFSDGQPCIYYGTEQAFQDRMDVVNTLGDRGRTDMFAGGFKSPGKVGDSFDETAEGFGLLQRMAEIRRAHAPLRLGEQYPRWSERHQPGVYAFSRIHEDEEVVVIMNTSDEAQHVSGMWVDKDLTPPGTELVDALHPDHVVIARPGHPQGTQLDFEIPPKSARVLVPRARQ